MSVFNCDAVEWLSSLDSESVDLLITDIYMPEVNGLDLITAAKSVNGATKTLCITGSFNRRAGWTVNVLR